MNNVYQEAFVKRDLILKEILNDKKENQFKAHVLKYGKVLYLYPEFNFQSFASSIKLHLFNVLKHRTESSEPEQDLIEIRYSAIESLADKLNINAVFKIILFRVDNILYFNIDLAEVTDNPEKTQYKFSITSLLNESHKKEITSFMYQSLYDKFLKKIQFDKLNEELRYTDKTHLNERTFINNICKDETILCKLNLSAFKDIENQEVSKSFFNGSFIITDKGICAFSFNKAGEVIIFDFLDKYTFRKKLTKYEITDNKNSFLSKRSNFRIFNEIKNIYKYEGSKRIKEFSKLSFLNRNYNSAEIYMNSLISTEDNSYNKLILFLIESKKKENEDGEFVHRFDIKDIVKKILNEKDVDEKLNESLKPWNLAFEEKTTLLQIFSEIADNKKEKEKILPFYDHIRTEFRRKNKDKIDHTLFDIKFAEFLIDSEKKRKALRLINKLQKNLPDETVSDLIPSKDTDLTSYNSGQLLEVSLLDLEVKAKGFKHAQDEIQRIAELQPLNYERINNLANSKNKDHKKKANDILIILKEGGLQSRKKYGILTNYKRIPDKIIHKSIKHPAIQKKGSFFSVQKWLSKIKADDYETVKEYSEQIKNENHPELFTLIENIKTVFGLFNLNCFISKGQKSTGIVGYSGTPAFIIIGNDHLNKQSDLMMNNTMLQFSLSSEIAHIYFKHTKITSNDVWRGVVDKGSAVLDALLAVAPVAGLLSKSVQNVSKLNGLKKILNQSDKIISGSKSAYDTAKKISDFYINSFKQNSGTVKENKLLAASRLMQYTADRAGLAVCGDLFAAVNAIFLTSNYNFALFEEAKKTSLKDLILKENHDGTYKNQELALRLSNLFSFYLSKEYDSLRDVLIKGI